VVTGWEGGLNLKGGTPATSGWKARACAKVGSGWEAGALGRSVVVPTERGKVGCAGTCIRVFLKGDYLRHSND
jgi:hypothetical protein